MAKGMNWRRCGYQVRARDRGSISLSDENDRLDNDRAARWLNARLKPRVQRPATAPSSATAPWER